MVTVSDLPEPEDKKYSLKFLIVTDLFCFFIGFGFHYLIEDCLLLWDHNNYYHYS